MDIIELKKVNCNMSPWIYSWRNHVIQERQHLLLTKSSRMIASISSEFKLAHFFAFRMESSNKRNVTSFYNSDEIGKIKMGFVLLDCHTSFECQKLLKMFQENFDDKTIFFSPYLVNFEGYENKTLDAIQTYSKNNNKKIKWMAHNGKIQLYDINDIGYNQGATFVIL